jgi:hypothetical protein
MVVDLTGEEAAVTADDPKVLVACDDEQIVTMDVDDDAADILDCEASFDHDGAEASEEFVDDDEGEGDGDNSDTDTDSDSGEPQRQCNRLAGSPPPPPPAPAPAPAAAPGPARDAPLSVGVIQILNFYISESDVNIRTGA